MEPMYEALSRAKSVSEILHVTRDYLASWSHDELERLPDSCRPSRVQGVQDIENWADRLLRVSGKTPPLFMDDERKLDRLTSHFLIASVRIRQLALHR